MNFNARWPTNGVPKGKFTTATAGDRTLNLGTLGLAGSWKPSGKNLNEKGGVSCGVYVVSCGFMRPLCGFCIFCDAWWSISRLICKVFDVLHILLVHWFDLLLFSDCFLDLWVCTFFFASDFHVLSATGFQILKVGLGWFWIMYLWMWLLILFR